MRVWPELFPLPSFRLAPIATVVPSAESDTEWPLSSSAASPSMSSPSWLQAVPFQVWICVLPDRLPLLSSWRAPTASVLPSADRDTDQPLRSPWAWPSISPPRWVAESSPLHSLITSCLRRSFKFRDSPFLFFVLSWFLLIASDEAKTSDPVRFSSVLTKSLFWPTLQHHRTIVLTLHWDSSSAYFCSFSWSTHSLASSIPSLLPWAMRCSSSTYLSLCLRLLSSLLIAPNGWVPAGSSSQVAACNPVVALPRATSWGRTFFAFVDILLTESTLPLWQQQA